MHYIVVEGLPALGKSETLALLARFYPERVVVLPELVKEVAEQERIDILTERDKLTAAITAALPRRREQIETAIEAGKLCLEESHLGVHLAYARALGDAGFIAAYPKLERQLPRPDLYLRFTASIPVSITRQKARNTPGYYIGSDLLSPMLAYLNEWHLARRTRLITVNADQDPSAFVSKVENVIGLRYVFQQAQVQHVFPLILLLGRPASGKSEFIDFMNTVPLSERATRYHIGVLRVLDDFPILWEKFIDDDIWEKLGRKRFHSRPADGNYAVADSLMWAFLIEKLAIAVQKTIEEMTSGETLIVEFSRGREHGYREALSHFPPEVLARAAILYVNVSFAESERRNHARYDKDQRDSILTHSVPQADMEGTYREDDWKTIAPAPSGRISVDGVQIPYVTMVNELELTDPALLDKRYHAALDRLWAEKSCTSRNHIF